MPTPELYTLLLRPLHNTGLEYVITGSVAVIAYGEPRMTNDVDVVMKLSPDDAPRLHRPFSSHDYYAPPIDVIAAEAALGSDGHFNIVHLESVLRADIYVAGDDPLHSWALEHRRAESVGGGTVYFAPLEYVVVRKLERLSHTDADRHLRDIRGMLRVSGDDFDRSTLERFVAERELGEAWRRVTST